MTDLEVSLYSDSLDIPVEAAMAECDELHVVFNESGSDSDLIITGEPGNLLCRFDGESYRNSSALTVEEAVLDVLKQAESNINIFDSTINVCCAGYIWSEVEDNIFDDVPEDTERAADLELIDEIVDAK